jgi:hypothetical protein
MTIPKIHANGFRIPPTEVKNIRFNEKSSFEKEIK